VASYTRAITDPITIPYAATIAPNAGQGTLFRVSATGNLTLTDPTGGVDGQYIRVEITASGAARTVTLAGALVAIPNGARRDFEASYDGTNWYFVDA
jgi:hypothetical protein